MRRNNINLLIIVLLIYIISILSYPDDLVFYVQRVPYLYFIGIVFIDIYYAYKYFVNPQIILRFDDTTLIIKRIIVQQWCYVVILLFPLLLGGVMSINLILIYIYIGQIYSMLQLFVIYATRKIKFIIVFPIMIIIYYVWYFYVFLYAGINPVDLVGLFYSNLALFIVNAFLFYLCKSNIRRYDLCK